MLDTTCGLIVAEAAMMGPAPCIGGQIAHDVVYQCCRQALAGQTEFAKALMVQPAIAGSFTRADIDALTDPANDPGSAPEMTRTLLRSRADP